MFFILCRHKTQMFILIFAAPKNVHVLTPYFMLVMLADVTVVLCRVGGARRAEGVLAKYFARRGPQPPPRQPGSLEAVLADLKASGQPGPASRGRTWSDASCGAQRG